MIPRDFITEWRAHAPWVADVQVEQDLVICRALVELFSRPLIARSLAFRGGTALYKLHLRPAARYSEDIDLVQIEAGPIGPVLAEVRAALDAARSAALEAIGRPSHLDVSLRIGGRAAPADEAEGRDQLARALQRPWPPARSVRSRVALVRRRRQRLHVRARRAARHEAPRPLPAEQGSRSLRPRPRARTAVRRYDNDRHVRAAAIRCGAQVIVTTNLRDFPAHALAPYDIEAQHPDSFVLHLLWLDPGAVLRTITGQANSLRNPPCTVAELLDTLESLGLDRLSAATAATGHDLRRLSAPTLRPGPAADRRSRGTPSCPAPVDGAWQAFLLEPRAFTARRSRPRSQAGPWRRPAAAATRRRAPRTPRSRRCRCRARRGTARRA